MAANDGTLAFMVGCDRDQFSHVEAALAPMARAVIHAGDAGAGQAAKICNNMVLGISMLGVCERFRPRGRTGAGTRSGSSRSHRSRRANAGRSPAIVPGLGPVPYGTSNRNYEGGFLTSLMSKDLKLAQEAAARSGAATPMGAQAQALYALFRAPGVWPEGLFSRIAAYAGAVGRPLGGPHDRLHSEDAIGD